MSKKPHSYMSCRSCSRDIPLRFKSVDEFPEDWERISLVGNCPHCEQIYYLKKYFKVADAHFKFELME